MPTSEYRGQFRDPLARSAGSALAGALLGGVAAPKGELLKYVLGGAGMGGIAGLSATTGANLGQHAANYTSDKYNLTGNANVAAQLGLPITGAIGGGLLSLPILRRIGQELDHEPERKEKEKTAAWIFGEKLAQGPIGSITPPNFSAMPSKQPGAPTPPKPPAGPRFPYAAGGPGGMASTAAGTAKPDPINATRATSAKNNPPPILHLQNMSANGGRIGGGILSAVAGGIGTVGTGLAAGATNAWNAVTPQSMNTSQGWSQGVNDVFNNTAEFTRKGVYDVYGGLGGDTNYATQHAWNHLDKGFNDPTVDPVSQNVAHAAGWAGHGAWNAATALANPGKLGLGYAGMAPRAANMAGNLGRAGRAVNNIDTASAFGVHIPASGYSLVNDVNWPAVGSAIWNNATGQTPVEATLGADQLPQPLQ